MSKSANRSSPVALAGTTQSGSIYVFTNTGSETKRVDFFLDDPGMTKAPRTTESAAPHDFSATAADGTAKPFATTSVANGSHTITARVVPVSGATQVVNAAFTVANGVVTPPPPPPPPPPPVCPVACSNVLVELPYTLPFTSDAGQIKDKNGVGTGFTWIMKPKTGSGYLPQNLAVDQAAGLLKVTTTSGLAYTSSNSQDNALAVGVDAPSQETLIKTTIKLPPAGTGNYEQAGLSFGIDQDNMTKLAIESTPSGPRVQHLLEAGGAEKMQATSGALPSPVSAIDLALLANPFDGTVTATYAVNGGLQVQLGKFTVPQAFFSFDGAGIDPTIGTRSFAGIFASNRRGPSPVVYSFSGFSVTDAGGPPTGPPPAGISFDRSSFPIPNPTAMVWGPDGNLYVAEMLGKIHRITLDASKAVVSDQVIGTLGSRLTLGLAIDPASTPSNVILWASHSSPSTNAGVANSGTVSRLSGPDLATKTDVITGLPRAIANHAINAIHFGPDGKLYIAMGSETGAGAPNTDTTAGFGTRAEQPLSAALLVADVNAPGFDGSCENTSDFFGPPPCDVQTFSTGLRNMYDFVIHSNGSIYGPVNGLGVAGSYPPSPTAPCFGFGSTLAWNAGGQNPGTQDDNLELLRQGRYYGHPNPSRGECVFGDGHYQGVAPLPNYTPPLLDLGAHKSADGTIEYQEDSFCGQLKGDLLMANYSIGDDITRVQLSADGTSVLHSDSLIGGFNDPLSLAQGPDGTIYVGEMGSDVVTSLKPRNPPSC